jgi:hypothetical protein
VPEAKAGGPYYVYFADYCDCITINTGVLGEHGNNWVFGTWDWKCDGSANTLVHGAKVPKFIFGTRPVDASGTPADFDVSFALEGTGQGSGHGDITATFDGVTNVLIAEEVDYFLRKAPPCPGVSNGNPPIFP